MKETLQSIDAAHIHFFVEDSQSLQNFIIF